MVSCRNLLACSLALVMFKPPMLHNAKAPGFIIFGAERISDWFNGLSVGEQPAADTCTA